MNRNSRLTLFTIALASLLAATPLAGCRNPGEEGQGQTHTPVTPDNQRSIQRRDTSPSPTADQVDPSSPKAVLDGTSTTSPSTSSPSTSSASTSGPAPH